MPELNGRIQIINGHPPILPGNCIVCKSVGGEGRKFIDFGLQLKRIGRVYFCEYCITEVMSQLGWFTSAQYEELALRNVELLQDLENAKEENGKLASISTGVLIDLRNDLQTLFPEQQSVKRSPGRPKGTNSRVTKSSSS